MGATASVARRRSYRRVPAAAAGQGGGGAGFPEAAPPAVIRVNVAPARGSPPVVGQLLARRKEARAAVKEVLQQEAAECSRHWRRLRDELDGCFDAWVIKEPLAQDAVQVKATLRAAMAVHDSVHLCMALRKAETLGMKSKPIKGVLDQLLASEDLEGTWLCLCSALQEDDHFALGFWLEEAKVKKLAVPQQVQKLWEEEEEQRSRVREQMEAMHCPLAQPRAHGGPGLGAGGLSAAAADRGSNDCLIPRRASRHDSASAQEKLDRKVREAFAAGNLQAVRNLAEEACRLGVDPGFAHAVALSLEDDHQAEEAFRNARAPRNKAEEAFAKKADAATAKVEQAEDALRGKSAKELKAELERRGVDTRGALEKDELVRLLMKDQKGRRPSASPPSRPSGGHQSGSSAPKQDQRRSSSEDKGGAGGGGGGQRSPPAPGAAGPGPSSSGGTGGTRANASGQPPASSNGPTRASSLACLGITSSDPTEEELRKAYKKAAMRWHPDRQHNHEHAEEAKQKFVEARAAYEYLLKGLPASGG